MAIMTSSSLNWTVGTYCATIRAVSVSGRPWTSTLPTQTDCSDNSTKVFTGLEVYTDYTVSSYVTTTGGHTSGTTNMNIGTLQDSKCNIGKLAITQNLCGKYLIQLADKLFVVRPLSRSLQTTC